MKPNDRALLQRIALNTPGAALVALGGVGSLQHNSDLSNAAVVGLAYIGLLIS